MHPYGSPFPLPLVVSLSNLSREGNHKDKKDSHPPPEAGDFAKLNKGCPYDNLFLNVLCGYRKLMRGWEPCRVNPYPATFLVWGGGSS